MNWSSKGGEELELWNSRPGAINFEQKLKLLMNFKKKTSNSLLLYKHLADKSEAHGFDEQGGFYQIYCPGVMVSCVIV